MIIVDAVDVQRKADTPYPGQTIRLPDQVTLRSLASLPDYDTSEKEQQELVVERRKSRFGSTFWRGVLVAFVVYVVLSVAIGVPIAVIKLKPEKNPRGPFPRINEPQFDLWGDDDPSNPLPLQTLRDSLFNNEVRCNVWDIAETSSSNPVLLATTQYKLPPQGLVTIRSNISYDADFFSGINGSLIVDINDNKKEKNIVFIVNLLSSSVDTRTRTNICFTDSGQNRGLTIYTPNTLEADESMSISVQVLLPASAFIDTFITYLPLFTQQYGDLEGRVSFNRLGIEGTNNMISCESLGGTQISVKNVLAAIRGSFNVTDRLALDTVRGAITANITLTQTTSALQPSCLSMDTGYSPINANITLSTQNPLDGFGPASFVTHVKTFNGEINLGISHADDTPSSTLSLHVQNALAQSSVQLDSKFQGMFNVQTKLDHVTVRNHTATPAPPKSESPTHSPGFPGPSDAAASDSSSTSTTRTVMYDTLSTSKAIGWVGYGPRTPNMRTPGQGQVEIISSLSPIVLDLG